MARRKSYAPKHWALPRETLPPNAVKSAARCLQLLELFDEVQRPVNVVEAAEALGFPQSSAYALMHTLENLGYLHVDTRTHTYVPTSRVSLLGWWANADVLRNGALLTLMEQLARETTEHVVLSIQQGSLVRYIHVVPASNPAQRRLPPGTTQPLAQTATGVALLSTYSDEELWGIVAPLYARGGRSTALLGFDELREAVTRARRLGYAQLESRLVKGGSTIAVPLPLKENGRPLAIGVAGFSTVLRRSRRDLVDRMQQGIRQFLGFSPGG